MVGQQFVAELTDQFGLELQSNCAGERTHGARGLKDSLRLASHGNQPVAAFMWPHFAASQVEQQACQHLYIVADQVLRKRKAAEEAQRQRAS